MDYCQSLKIERTNVWNSVITRWLQTNVVHKLVLLSRKVIFHWIINAKFGSNFFSTVLYEIAWTLWERSRIWLKSIEVCRIHWGEGYLDNQMWIWTNIWQGLKGAKARLKPQRRSRGALRLKPMLQNSKRCLKLWMQLVLIPRKWEHSYDWIILWLQGKLMLSYKKLINIC